MEVVYIFKMINVHEMQHTTNKIWQSPLLSEAILLVKYCILCMIVFAFLVPLSKFPISLKSFVI